MSLRTAVGTHLPRWGCDVRLYAARSAGFVTAAVHGRRTVTLSRRSVAEVLDSNTAVTQISYEDLGLANPLDTDKTVEAEVTTAGELVPDNPSGGRQTAGYAPGFSGTAQEVELFGRLRGEAINQFGGVRIGLTHILERSGAPRHGK